MGAAHIDVTDLSYRCRSSGRLALDGVSFSVGRGERVAIVGRSGAGKSTLLQLIAGLARPASGQIAIDGRPVRAPWPRCNLMFQRPLLFPWLDVAGNVKLASRFCGLRSQAAAQAARLLRLVGLESYAAARPHELSGGQQQRVALARALAVDPEVLLLDEPLSALDPATRLDLRAAIRAIVDALGVTLIVVTHDVDEALDLASRTIVMASSPGRIVDDVATSEATRLGAGDPGRRARVLASLSGVAAAV